MASGGLLVASHRNAYWSAKIEASYPYGNWLKHLVLLTAHGMSTLPKTVGEFGPGDSLGVGLSALLSGARRYCAFDVADFTQRENDLMLLEQLAQMLRARAPRPHKGFPDFDEHLDSSLFPHQILREPLLREALAPDRVADLKAALSRMDPGERDAPIQMVAPWRGKAHEFVPEFEMLLSHSVLQYMSDIELFFNACMRLLRPGGWMSHQVDFGSMGLSRDWNGHLAYPDSVWQFMVNRRPFAPNRKLLSEYLRGLKTAGFDIVSVQKLLDRGGVQRQQLAPNFRVAADEDLACRGAFVIARKPN